MAREEVKVLGFWLSPFVMRVRCALQLKGLDYTYIEEDLSHKSPLLLQLNPVYKAVPVLLHRDKPIPDSFLILEYIDETWPDHTHKLLPVDPYQRALARFWAKVGDEKLMKCAWIAVISLGKEKEEAVKSAIELLGLIQGELKNDFFGGESIGFLDLLLGWSSYSLPVLEEVGSMKIMDEAQFSVIHLWAQRFMAHPEIKPLLPPRDQLLEYFRLRMMGAQ